MRVGDIKKVIAWRLISIFVSMALAYLYLGEIRAAGELTIIFTVVMTVLHYFFEAWWDNSKDRERAPR